MFVQYHDRKIYSSAPECTRMKYIFIGLLSKTTYMSKFGTKIRQQVTGFWLARIHYLKTTFNLVCTASLTFHCNEKHIAASIKEEQNKCNNISVTSNILLKFVDNILITSYI